MSKHFECAIVGAGFAGLAAALLLERQGHRVTLYEQHEQSMTLGAGILLQPSSFQALHTLGLWDGVHAQGEKVHRLHAHEHVSGAPVLDVTYSDGEYGIGIARSVVYQALWHKVQNSNVVFKKHCLVDSALLKQLQRQADVVLMCTGSKSVLTRGWLQPKVERWYDWGCLWTLIDEPQYSTHRLSQSVWGSDKMLGFLPSGCIDGQRKVSAFWSMPFERQSVVNGVGMSADALRGQIEQMLPMAPQALRPVLSSARWSVARYKDVQYDRFRSGNVWLLGDSAHAMSPQLGQGANMALIDALALSKQVQAVADGQCTWEQAAVAYEKARKAHVHFYQQASRFLTPLYQSNSSLAPYVRKGLYWASRIGPIGRINTDVLRGERTGWLGGRYKP